MLSNTQSWHIEHPFEKMIRSVVPTSRWVFEIEKCLLEIWVQSQYDYRIYKSKDTSTLFDLDLDLLAVKRRVLEEEMKSEEATFQKLFTKLSELGSPTEVSEEDTSDPPSEEEAVKGGKRDIVLKPTHLAHPTNPKKISVAVQKYQALQAKTLRTSLAASQQKRMDLQTSLDELVAKTEAYTRYQAASRFYQRELCRIALTYKDTQDDSVLIQSLESLLSDYHWLLKKDAPRQPCKGMDALCETHFMPLQKEARCAIGQEK